MIGRLVTGRGVDVVGRTVARYRWPRRRARLPGRHRLRELARDPRRSLGRFTPSRLRATAPIDDDARLIGLLMVRDESDVLGEMLATARQWFDRILVLDGTTRDRDRTRALLEAVPEVVHVVRDEDLPGGGPPRDGARQVLLDEARRRWGVDNWIGVLHADEFMDQDPRPLLAAHNPLLDPSLRVRLVHTFLHTDDEASWSRRGELPLRQRLTHAMWPGVPEARFFFDAGDRDYEMDRHSKVIPGSLRPGPLIDGYVIVQYNERSPEQVRTRARQRMADQWQGRHYHRFADAEPQVFVDTLDTSEAPFAPEFVNPVDGPFEVVRLDEIAPPSQPGAPAPVFLDGDVAGDAATAVAGALGDGPRVVTRMTHLTAPGGLVDLVEGAGPRARLAFAARMRRFAADDPDGWGHLATSATSPPRHYPGELDLLLTVLGSRRTTVAHRRTAARQFVARTRPGAHTADLEWVDVAPGHLRRAEALRALFPGATVLTIGGSLQ